MLLWQPAVLDLLCPSFSFLLLSLLFSLPLATLFPSFFAPLFALVQALLPSSLFAPLLVSV
jgi:hypothetical protein